MGLVKVSLPLSLINGDNTKFGQDLYLFGVKKDGENIWDIKRTLATFRQQ
jgi:hypothetical protein